MKQKTRNGANIVVTVNTHSDDILCGCSSSQSMESWLSLPDYEIWNFLFLTRFRCGKSKFLHSCSSARSIQGVALSFVLFFRCFYFLLNVVVIFGWIRIVWTFGGWECYQYQLIDLWRIFCVPCFFFFLKFKYRIGDFMTHSRMPTLIVTNWH